jgi:hypothetical protein
MKGDKRAAKSIYRTGARAIVIIVQRNDMEFKNSQLCVIRCSQVSYRSCYLLVASYNERVTVL